jgi:glycosyltransferase involved in cell wall biosynthesis
MCYTLEDVGQHSTSPHRPMRLLYLIRDPFPCDRPDVLTLFGERLPDLGITSDIVAVRRGPLAESARAWPSGIERAIRPYRIPAGSAIAGLVNDVKALLRASEYDGIVVRDKVLTAWIALWLRRSRPVYYWMSFPFPEEDLERSRGPLGGKLLRTLLWVRGRLSAWMLYGSVVPRASAVFVQSEHMRDVVATRSSRRRGLIPVPMGVDERIAPPAQATRQWRPGEPFRLVYLGLLDRNRRIDFLVDVLRALEERMPGTFVLRLIGDANTPEEMQWLRERIRESGVESLVELTGALPRGVAWKEASACHAGLSALPRGDIFDVSSPTKTVEYLLLGLPVVVNDIPDQARLVDQTSAGLCRSMDPDAFTDAIIALRDEYDGFAARAAQARTFILRDRNYGKLASAVADVLSKR